MNTFCSPEEIDFCWRLQLAGYKIFVQPASVVYHVGGGTLPMGDREKVYLNFRNNLIMLTKNLPVGQAWWKVPFRIGLDIIAGLKGLFTGSVVTFTAIIKAHLHYLGWLFLREGKIFLKEKKTTKLQGVYNGLVIWQYFIKRKKHFQKLLQQKIIFNLNLLFLQCKI